MSRMDEQTERVTTSGKPPSRFISLSTIFLVSVPYKIKPLEIIWPVNWHSLNKTAKSRTMNIYTADKPLCKLLYF